MIKLQRKVLVTFIVLLVFAINIIIFLPFFNLSLFGDDWLTITRYSYYVKSPQHLGPYSKHFFTPLTYFFNSYGPQDTLLYYLYSFFGENSNAYFIISYILRIAAGISLYIPASLITKKKILSWFAVFFFIFSPVGLETSNWVFNMPSYIAIVFFSLFVYFYLNYHNSLKIRDLFMSFITFFLTFISNPIRAHGLIPFVLFIEIYFLISKKGRKSILNPIITISGFLLIYLIILQLGFKESISGNPLGGIHDGVVSTYHFISQHRIDFLFYPLVTLGSLLIPDSAVGSGNINSIGQYIFGILLPIYSIFIAVVFIFKRGITNIKHEFVHINLITGLIWSLIVVFVYYTNISTFSAVQYIAWLLIGGYFLIITLTLCFCLSNYVDIKKGLILILGWIFFSYIFPWWLNPSFIYITTHRYLIIANVGLSLILAFVISLNKNSKKSLILTLLLISLLILHASFTNQFIVKQYNTHNKFLSKKIWSQMPYISAVGKSSRPLVFYFEGTPTNGDILHDVVTFGFPPHMGIKYGISDYTKYPVAMDSWEEVVSAVKDGKSLKRLYGVDMYPIPINNVYVFKLDDSGKLTNLTDEARQKLRES